MLQSELALYSTFKYLLKYSYYLNKVTAAQVAGTLLSLLVPDFVD